MDQKSPKKSEKRGERTNCAADPVTTEVVQSAEITWSSVPSALLLFPPDLPKNEMSLQSFTWWVRGAPPKEKCVYLGIAQTAIFPTKLKYKYLLCAI